MRPRLALSIWLLGLMLLTGGVALSPPAAAQARKPIKIGFLAPLTGGAAQWGNPIQNIYVRKVERKGGELQNTVIQTFPSVSQFWTYKPDDYLKLPVYNRDYPPCKGC